MGTGKSGADDKTEFIRRFCFPWGSILMQLPGSGKEKRKETKTGFSGADQSLLHTVKHKITGENIYDL